MFGLTQDEFGKKIYKSRRTIQEWEAGKNMPVDTVFEQIVITFNVNPLWLRSGEGEMFIEKEKPRPKGMDSRDALIMAGLRMATDEQKDFILKYIEEKRELSELRKKDKIKKAQAG